MPVRWPLSNADQVRAYIAKRDSRCPTCRYCLRGLRDARCPECGGDLSVPAIVRANRPWLERFWIGVDERTGGQRRISTALWLAIAANVLIATAIILSAVEHGGRMPVLSWAAPAVLGAFIMSLNYAAVFIRRDALPSDLWPAWSVGTAWALAAVQATGLILIWV